MLTQASAIPGAWVFTAERGDDRGAPVEWFRRSEVDRLLGDTFQTAQANCSWSRQGVIRGIHFAEVPRGQAKYVTCVGGAVMDVVIDVRIGSPCYGQWRAVRLDEANGRAVLVPAGLGHAFMTLSPEATVVYLCSAPYISGYEHGVHPLDPAIGIAWPADITPVLSAKDAAAPALEQLRQSRQLPQYCGA